MLSSTQSVSRSKSAPTGVRRQLISVFLFSVFTNILMLTGPLFMLQVYDRVLSSGSEETLVALTGLVIILYGLFGILEYARGRIAARIGARFHDALSMQVFRTTLDGSNTSPDNRTAQLHDLEAIRTFWTSPICLVFFDLPWTPIFAVAIFIFHPLLGWLALGGGTVLLLATFINQWLTSKNTLKAQTFSLQAQQFAAQSRQCSDVIQAQGMVGAISNRWARLQRNAAIATLTANDGTGALTAFSKSFRFLLQSGMLAVGAWLVLQGELTAGAMIAGSILMGRALAPIEQGLAQWHIAQRAWASYRALRQLSLSQPTKSQLPKLPRPSSRISVHNLSFSPFGTSKPILCDLSFDIPAGTALGVIGRSGSGKTTLARALVGLEPSVLGAIRLGGATLGQYGSDQLGQYVGYLPQNVQIFQGTIAQNIAQMDEAATMDQIISAARQAHVHNMILDLPDGYATELDPQQPQLSGGGLQRLALARALFRDPVLLVLDEPNSALDAEGSAALNKVVQDLKQRGKTVVLMTHRPAAIHACDTLMVLHHGTIAGLGPRDQIIRTMVQNADGVHPLIVRGATS